MRVKETLIKSLVSCTTVFVLFYTNNEIFKYINNGQELKENTISFEKLTVTENDNYFNESASTKPKIILLWTRFFKTYIPWDYVFYRQMNNQCGSVACRFITDRSQLDEADAVLFHGHNLEKYKKIFLEERYQFPQSRNENQIFIFFTLEAPSNLKHINMEYYSHFFNWTMTYRKDSDVVVPYAKLIPLEEEEKSDRNVIEVTEHELREKKDAIWFVSNCHTKSNREKVVKKLQRQMKIDIYGKCGNFTCGSNMVLIKGLVNWSDTCRHIIQSYKFYLSFENSLCKDYVTEKLYRALDLGIIPVVFGGANYTDFAPPNSFINVLDFATLTDLTRYLRKVGNNATLYNSYLKWKQEFRIDLGHPFRPHSCDLCYKLHNRDPDTPHKSYENMKKWFIEDSFCHRYQ